MRRYQTLSNLISIAEFRLKRILTDRVEKVV